MTFPLRRAFRASLPRQSVRQQARSRWQGRVVQDPGMRPGGNATGETPPEKLNRRGRPAARDEGVRSRRQPSCGRSAAGCAPSDRDAGAVGRRGCPLRPVPARPGARRPRAAAQHREPEAGGGAPPGCRFGFPAHPGISPEQSSSAWGGARRTPARRHSTRRAVARRRPARWSAPRAPPPGGPPWAGPRVCPPRSRVGRCPDPFPETRDVYRVLNLRT